MALLSNGRMRLDEKTWSKEIVAIKGPDVLRKTTLGSELKIVQLKPASALASNKPVPLGTNVH